LKNEKVNSFGFNQKKVVTIAIDSGGQRGRPVVAVVVVVAAAAAVGVRKRALDDVVVIVFEINPMHLGFVRTH